MEIEDLSVLSGLTGLKRLELPGDKVQSLRGLENLAVLRILKLFWKGGTAGKITDLTRLKKLVLYYNNNVGRSEPLDISCLRNLTDLSTLKLPAYITDLGSLRNLTE